MGANGFSIKTLAAEPDASNKKVITIATMATSAVNAFARSLCRNRILLTGRKSLSTTASRAEAANPGGAQRSHEEATKWVEEKVKKASWHGFGYWTHDRRLDYQTGHFVTFLSCGLIACTFMWYYYYPDMKMQDWMHREAYLLIREREAKGQVLVCRDLIDPSKFDIPEDEELGDCNIII